MSHYENSLIHKDSNRWCWDMAELKNKALKVFRKSYLSRALNSLWWGKEENHFNVESFSAFNPRSKCWIPPFFSLFAFGSSLTFKKLKFVSCGTKRIFVFLFSWLVKSIFKCTFPPSWTGIHSVAHDGHGIWLLVHLQSGGITGMYCCAQTCWGYLFTFGDRVSLCSPCCLVTCSWRPERLQIQHRPLGLQAWTMAPVT